MNHLYTNWQTMYETVKKENDLLKLQIQLLQMPRGKRLEKRIEQIENTIANTDMDNICERLKRLEEKVLDLSSFGCALSTPLTRSNHVPEEELEPEPEWLNDTTSFWRMPQPRMTIDELMPPAAELMTPPSSPKKERTTPPPLERSRVCRARYNA